MDGTPVTSTAGAAVWCRPHYYSADINHPNSPPAGEGVWRCHVSFREERSSHTIGVPDLPLLSEVRDLHVSPGPSSVHARTPTRGSGTVPRHYYRQDTAGRPAQSSRDQGRNPSDSDARRLPIVYFLQYSTTVPRDSRENDDFYTPHSCAPPILTTIKGEGRLPFAQANPISPIQGWKQVL